MADYISREDAIDELCENCFMQNCSHDCDTVKVLRRVPAADVVTRDCFNCILAENDKLREENKELRKTTAYLTATTPKEYSGDWGNYG